MFFEHSHFICLPSADGQWVISTSCLLWDILNEHLWVSGFSSSQSWYFSTFLLAHVRCITWEFHCDISICAINKLLPYSSPPLLCLILPPCFFYPSCNLNDAQLLYWLLTIQHCHSCIILKKSYFLGICKWCIRT